MRNCSSRSIMNVGSTSNFENLVDCINDGILRLQQLLAISDQLVPVSIQTSIGFTRTAAMDQVSNCRVCLDLVNTTTNCSQISNAEMFIHERKPNIHNKLSRCTNYKRNGSSPIGGRGQHLFRNLLLSFRNGSQEQR